MNLRGLIGEVLNLPYSVEFSQIEHDQPEVITDDGRGIIGLYYDELNNKIIIELNEDKQE